MWCCFQGCFNILWCGGLVCRVSETKSVTNVDSLDVFTVWLWLQMHFSGTILIITKFLKFLYFVMFFIMNALLFLLVMLLWVSFNLTICDIYFQAPGKPGFILGMTSDGQIGTFPRSYLMVVQEPSPDPLLNLKIMEDTSPNSLSNMVFWTSLDPVKVFHLRNV